MRGRRIRPLLPTLVIVWVFVSVSARERLGAQPAAVPAIDSPVSCIDVRGGVMSPRGRGELLARSAALCTVAHQWFVWHISGIGSMLDGSAQPFDRAPYDGPDLALLSAQSQIERSWRVVLDSVSHDGAAPGGQRLWFQLHTGLDSIADTPLLRWRVQHRAVGDRMTFRFDDASFPTEPILAPHHWMVRVHGDARQTFDMVQFRRQLDSVVALRTRFGSAGELPRLTVLIAPPADTVSASIGVTWSASPQFASLWYRRAVLASPVASDGGIDFHELAHLVHPNDRPINGLFAEAFAVAIGGSMGHSLGHEWCVQARDPSVQRRLATLTPSGLLREYDHLGKLLLATALNELLHSARDLTGLFNDRYWRPPANPWQDLAAFTGKPLEHLLRESLDGARRVSSDCR